MQLNKAGEQRSFNRFGRFSIILALVLTPLFAKESFKDFKKSQTQTFLAYKDEKDRSFGSYLKEEWEAYVSQEPQSMYEKPKPAEIDKAKVSELKPVGPKISLEIKEQPKTPEAEQMVQEQKKERDISFDFFGTALGVDVADEIKRANFYPQNKNGISNFFNSVAVSDYDGLLSYVQKRTKEMNLNDWGVYLLVSKMSDSIYSNMDDARLLRWFLLNKLGYAVKVALADKHVVLMHYSKKIIYDTPSFMFEGKKYYVLESYAKDDIQRVFTYKLDYPDATKELDMSLSSLPLLANDIKKKSLSFKSGDEEYKIELSYNKNLIEFMGTYPQADYETYFNAPMDDMTYRELAFWFKERLDGKKASEAMNFVLGFVQKSFKYEPDSINFSREKVMFAQETLYYDKSDCEDRAVLFAYLMRELFGVSVVGVKYEDHMATALYIPLDGEKVKVGKKEFVIADPTYVNAAIGVGMPKYRSIKPQSYIVLK